MQLSRLSYYADFIVYPVVFVSLAAVGITRVNWRSGIEWIAAALAGLVLWTLLEYVIHRIALHRRTMFAPMHGLHHASPLALIATPSWISVATWGTVILIPAWLIFGFNVANGLTVGVMLGYWWYGIVHHVIHHRAGKRPTLYFNGLRSWHMLHHYSPKNGNFGVTTSLWDRAFRTAIATGGKAVVSSGIS